MKDNYQNKYNVTFLELENAKSLLNNAFKIVKGTEFQIERKTTDN